MAQGSQERYRIAEPYSKALVNSFLEAPSPEGSTDLILSQLTTLQELLDLSSDFKAFCTQAPTFPKKEVSSAIRVLSQKLKLHDLTVGLLLLLGRKNRLHLLQEIVELSKDIFLEKNHIGQAKVSSAISLEASQQKKFNPLVKSLFESQETASGYTDYHLDFQVDPSLLGGVVVQLNSLRVDASLKGKFVQLTHVLKSQRKGNGS